MITHGKSIKIFTGNANPKLAKDIAEALGVKVGDSNVGKFSDG
ncbi:ribose-phosphate pyrophosphokinase-like domain-containing protein, partial [Clostridium haemolyticum]